MRLTYFSNKYNFGDILNLNILKDVFSINNIKQCNDVFNADMIAIGSLMEMLIYNDDVSLKTKIYRKIDYFKTKKINVFGTGFMFPQTYPESLKRKINIVALRGVNTKNRLKNITNKKYSNVSLGDPGLLSNQLIEKPFQKAYKYNLGIIPHYIDKENPVVKTISNSIPNSKIIDIQQEPIAFLNEIKKYRTIISSAMHGLIAADSLGIPNIRMILSDKIAGGNYKFDDYYSVFKIDNHLKIDFTKDTSFVNDTLFLNNLVNRIETGYQINSKQVEEIQNKLYNSFKKSFK